MADSIDLWRAAMKDEAHPRYKAAWVLFSPTTKPKAAARLLQEQSVEIIPWLLEILDTPELLEKSSLGKGKAPCNAVLLLGEWQVIDILPRLLTIIETRMWDDDLFDATISALQVIGPEAYEPVMQLFEQIEHEKKVDLSAVICRLGAGDERAFIGIQRVFEQENDDSLKLFLANNLAELNQQRAMNYLSQAARKSRFGPRMTNFIRDPRTFRL